jgi:hypothetical protein
MIEAGLVGLVALAFLAVVRLAQIYHAAEAMHAALERIAVALEKKRY